MGEILYEYKHSPTHTHIYASLQTFIDTDAWHRPPFFWHSWTKLAQHLCTQGADSPARQIRVFSARRCIHVSFVCCSCLSGSGLLWWLSNPQALITRCCLSHGFLSACWQSQVWTRPKEVDATVHCSYCWLHRGKKIHLSLMDFLVIMFNICFCLLAHSKDSHFLI